jgi:hypothetical protein
LKRQHGDVPIHDEFFFWIGLEEKMSGKKPI